MSAIKQKLSKKKAFNKGVLTRLYSDLEVLPENNILLIVELPKPICHEISLKYTKYQYFHFYSYDTNRKLTMVVNSNHPEMIDVAYSFLIDQGMHDYLMMN